MTTIRKIINICLVLCLFAGIAVAGSEKALNSLFGQDGLRAGICVIVEPNDIKTALGLAERNPNLLIHVIYKDDKKMEDVRQGLAGSQFAGRVAVNGYDGSHLPYVSHFVNSMVLGANADLPESEIMRVLVPKGTAYLRQKEGWRELTKPGQEEMDEWTHYLHGPERNPVSKDKLAGPPSHLQWVAPPRWAWSPPRRSPRPPGARPPPRSNVRSRAPA